MNDITGESAAEPRKVQPFTTSKTKFIAMSVCTFGLYEVFWSYRNWRYVKDRDASGIRPVWRAVFYPLWHYSLLSELASAVDPERLSSAGYRAFLAGSLVLLSATWRLPDPYWLLSFLTFLPFLPAVGPAESDASSGLIQEPVSFHRPVNFIAYLLGGPLVAFVCLSSIGYFPSTAVVRGDHLWDRDVEYLKEEGILGPDEEILYFYSHGLWSIMEDGQFISNDYVTSYWLDPSDGETYMAFAAYEEIEDIEVAWGSGLFETTVVTVTYNDGLEFDVWLSNEAGGDRKFVEVMRSLWKASNKGSADDL